MAIKIKNKSKQNEEEVEKEGVEDDESSLEKEIEDSIVDNADRFQSAAVQGASWASKHSSTVIGGVIAVVVIAAAAYFLLSYLENRKVHMSSELNEVFQANSSLIKGSEDYKSIEKAKPDFQIPAFDSEQKRQEKILHTAQGITKDSSGEPIEVAALLAQASAFLNLDKPEDAQKSYEKILKSAIDKNVLVIARYGLVESLSAQKKYAEAIKNIDELGANDKKLAKNLRFMKAKLFEAMGSNDKAKKLYHEILDENAAGMAKSDIERRIANL